MRRIAALGELALLDEPGEPQDDEPRRAQDEARRAQEEATACAGRRTTRQEEARRSMERDDTYYRRGKSYLDRKNYDQAIESFNRVIENKGSRADGALYWRAYAQNRLGKRDEALASLSELQKTYPKSRWLDDAKALEAEIRQKSGQPLSPESTADEDLKLLALQALAESDPERSIPMLEKILKSNNSPKLKERALFVLAQSHQPKIARSFGVHRQRWNQSRSSIQSDRISGRIRRPRQFADSGGRLQEQQRCPRQTRHSEQLHGVRQPRESVGGREVGIESGIEGAGHPAAGQRRRIGRPGAALRQRIRRPK